MFTLVFHCCLCHVGPQLKKHSSPALAVVLCALQWTDECNAEYEAQLNFKREKMRQQLQHLEALRQNIVQLNHQLEHNDGRGAASRILRQNTNYRSLPLGTKLQSMTDNIAQQNNQHCRDTMPTQKSGILTYRDNPKVIHADSLGNPSGVDNIDLPVAAVGAVAPSNSDQWSQQPVVNNDVISRSDNLRNTSYKTNDPPEREQTLQSKDAVYTSPRLKLNDVGSASTEGRPSVDVDGHGELVLLPDIIGCLSDNVASQNASGHNISSSCGSTDTTATVFASAASKVPPAVAQKPKFRHPHLSDRGMASSDGAAISTEPNLISTVPLDSVDTGSSSPVNTRSSGSDMLYDPSSTTEQDFSLEKPVLMNMPGKSALNMSADLGQKETFSDDIGHDLSDGSRLVDRPAYRPSVTYPVRRRLSLREGHEFMSSSPSVDTQGKADTPSTTEDPAVCTEGSLSKVQTVKNKLQAGASRKVQFEPLALLLDAALEGEIDLLQTTLKVSNLSFTVLQLHQFSHNLAVCCTCVY